MHPLKSERFIEAVRKTAIEEYDKAVKEADKVYKARFALARDRYIMLMNEEYKSGERKYTISQHLCKLL